MELYLTGNALNRPKNPHRKERTTQRRQGKQSLFKTHLYFLLLEFTRSVPIEILIF